MEVGDLACNLLWPCSLIETSADRVSEIHRSQKVYLAERQGVRKSDFYSESLSVECLCCYICNAAGRRFQTKPRTWFILIKTYKIATFLGYLDYLAQFKLYAYVRKAITQSENNT